MKRPIFLFVAGSIVIFTWFFMAVVEAQQTQNITVNIQGEEVRPYEESHALVIGINEYNQGWPGLRNAVKDAEALKSELELVGFDVTFKQNLDYNELEKAFKEFFYIKGNNPNSRLLIYFSGYGHTINNEGFLVAKDTPNPDNVSQFLLKALSMRRFEEHLRFTKAKHIFVVLDSCFSPTIFQQYRAAPPPILLAAKSPVRQFLTSGIADQPVADNGKFREIFIRALREEEADSNKDGYLTGSELSLFLEDKITTLTGRKQTPRWGKTAHMQAGEFIFALSHSRLFQDRLKDGGTGPLMVKIPAKQIRMGDIQGVGYDNERPVVNAYVRNIAASVYEITFEEYDRFCEATTECKKPADKGWGRVRRPVINVSWKDAVAYTKWLSEQTGSTYRLPTEMEWEYIARAGTETMYWWGDNIGSANAACEGCGSEYGLKAKNMMTAEVTHFEPNPYGIYNTVGNVGEWTCSEYSPGYGLSNNAKETYCIDSSNLTFNTLLVVRGGAWDESPKHVRVSFRDKQVSDMRKDTIGFRVVKELR